MNSERQKLENPPEKRWQLLQMAVDDCRSVQRKIDAGETIRWRMERWLSNDEKGCTLCVAGAVLRERVGDLPYLKPGMYIEDILEKIDADFDEDVYNQWLEASQDLDDLRKGYVGGLSGVGIDLEEQYYDTVLSGIYRIPTGPNDGAPWFELMEKTVEFLKEHDL